MPKINADFLRRLREQADVVQIIGEFIDLQKTGSTYKACCPFHDEKSPSFTVSPVRQTYKCFGCGKSGDALDFIISYRTLSLPEAAIYLAGRLNELVEYDTDNRPKSRFDGIQL